MKRIDRYLKHLEAGTLDEYYESRRRQGRKLSKYTKGNWHKKGQGKFIGKCKRV